MAKYIANQTRAVGIIDNFFLDKNPRLRKLIEAPKKKAKTSSRFRDFDEIDGWVAGGTNASNVTYYDTGIITSWDTSGFNVVTLSQQALNDIEGLTLFKCCFIDWNNDIRNAAPVAPSGAINYSGVHYADMAVTLNDPKLVVTEKDNPVFFGANF